MCAYNAGQPRQETQELYLTDGKSLSVSNGRFPNRTLYLQNVPNGHWYHFYIVSRIKIEASPRDILSNLDSISCFRWHAMETRI